MDASTGSAHLLRMEGVNLGAVCDDTNEISVRRGAGLLLRQAVRDVAARFKPSGLTPISLGASVGLFEVRTAAPDALVTEIASYLSDDALYRHLTFVVDSVPLGKDFRAAREQVVAANRCRQYRQLTLVVPEPGDGGIWCAADQISPGRAELRFKKEQEAASPSAAARFAFGRDARNAFYRQELGKAVTDDFTQDLQSLAQPADGIGFGNLDHKVAVIYLDGNKFGDLQRQCASAADLRRFDRTVGAGRRDFLDRLLTIARADPAGFRNGSQLRLEILLWGGDEILLVVPAWKGLETLQCFYEVSNAWAFDQQPLTHAGGIVFCQGKTPIVAVRRTAEDLANEVKAWIANDKERAERGEIKDDEAALRRRGNRFAYLVLESVDYPTEDLDVFRDIRYGPAVAGSLEPLTHFAAGSGAAWTDLANHLAPLLQRWPRGAIYDVAMEWVRARRAGSEPARQTFTDRVRRLYDTSDAQLETELNARVFRHLVPNVDPHQTHDHAGWLHLVELWDYLAPEPRRHQEATA
jgi:hypothetical protein